MSEIKKNKPKSKKRVALHRGLEKLLAKNVLDADSNKKEENIQTQETKVKEAEDFDPVEVEIEKIELNPDQPRSIFNEEELVELSTTIKAIGVISPLTVTKIEDGYQLIAGERRLRASKMAGLSKVPVVVMKRVSKKQRVVIGLVENLQRSDLNDIEIAESFLKLQNDFDLSHDGISELTGKSRSNVSNTMRLLKLPEEIKESLIERKISTGHARCLLGVSDLEKQHSILNKIIDNKLSVRQLEELVNSLHDKRKKSRKAPKEINPDLNDALFQMSQFLGIKIDVQENSKGGGKIVLKYSDTKDFNRIFEKITK